MDARMIELSKEKDRVRIQLIAIPMGDDLAVTIGGGDKPHIGAVALGIPAPSQHVQGKINASVSVLTLTGHKEDELARKAVSSLSRDLNRVVVVCCGIHIDAITPEGIAVVVELVDALVSELTWQVTTHGIAG
jgi:hypothetical protein